jgi:hypothetical protein
MKKIIALLSIVPVGLCLIELQRIHNELYEAFPDLDRKVLRKTFRKLVRRAAFGELGYIREYNQEQIDDLFITTYHEVMA